MHYQFGRDLDAGNVAPPSIALQGTTVTLSSNANGLSDISELVPLAPSEIEATHTEEKPIRPRRVVLSACPFKKAPTSGDEEVFDFLMVVWKEDVNFFFVRHHEMVFDVDELRGNAIPSKHLRPLWDYHLPIASTPLPEGSYVKSTNVKYYMGDDRLAQYLLDEAKFWAQLESGPHPNIGRFRGCVLSDDGTIAGLCSQRYARTLKDAVEYASATPSNCPATLSEELDPASILRGIASGVTHLHSLKLVHNDLNPQNIMLDDTNVPKLIDFDAMMKGSKVFTRPWGRRNSQNVAMFENDYLSLGLIALYLKGEFPPENRKLDPDLIEPAIIARKAILHNGTFFA
jgi:Protein kinase domain